MFMWELWIYTLTIISWMLLPIAIYNYHENSHDWESYCGVYLTFAILICIVTTSITLGITYEFYWKQIIIDFFSIEF